MMNARTAIELVRHLGVGWAAYRAWYAVSQRAGVLRRRAPAAKSWDAITLADLVRDPKHADPTAFRDRLEAEGGRFLFGAAQRTRYAERLKQFDAGVDPGWTEAKLAEISGGRLRYFSGSLVECGWPPRWAGWADGAPREVACDHFSQVNEFGHGDVKLIWEPSRFAFAYDLVRIYWRTGDERCAELFWKAVDDWRRHNPPNAGINWKCGQEAALRAMAWCFGVWGFAGSPHTTPHRAAALAVMLAGTARRIEANVR